MEGLLGGVGRIANSLFGAAPVSSMTPEQNEQMRKQALTAAGLQMLMNSRSGAGQPAPGTLQILASGMMAGQQAGGAAQAQAQAQAALQNPALGLTPQQRATIAALPPAQQAEVLKELATRQPQRHNVGPGATLTDENGNPIFQAPFAPGDPWSNIDGTWRGALSAQGVMDPNTATPAQWAAAAADVERLRRAGGTSVTINPYERAVGAGAQNLYSQAITQFSDSNRMLNAVARAEAAMDRGARTGGMQSATMGLRNFLSDAGIPGIDVDNITDQQALQAASNEIALMMKEGMTGQMSDRDILFLLAQAPQLSNTEEANRILLEGLRRTADWKRRRAIALDGYLQQHQDGAGALQFLYDWEKENAIDFADLAARVRAAAQEIG